MRARGIRSYHRPGRLEEALALLAQGAVPVGGGTRLFAEARDLPNLLDLQALELGGITLEDGDLLLGASVPLQDVLDSDAAHATTAGLLPAACRAQSPSRMLRGMATVAGEAVYGAPDSAVAAALLALNAVFVIAHPQEPRESPALRFVQKPDEDLRGGGLVQRVLIPGAPDGAALERASVLPSAPPLALVAVTVAFSGEKCSRARIAVACLQGRPQRVLEAEAQVERTAADEADLERAADEAARLPEIPGDDAASLAYRRHLVRVLT
ncbi:MAG TPA: FAD binding domain-containing protein, partial [Vicinamibacteria bacterium]